LIVRIADVLVFAGLLVGAAVLAIMAWSKRHYSPKIFVAAGGFMLVLSVARLGNSWPTLLAELPTAAPLQLALIGILGVGAVSLTISAALVGLALGAVPHRLTMSGELTRTDAARLGIAVGLFGAAASAIAGAVRAPAWAQAPHVEAAGALIPILQTALEPAIRVLMATAVLLPTLLTVDHLTGSWRRRRIVGALLLALVGFAAIGIPPTTQMTGWLVGVAAIGAALIAAYVTALRFDLSMLPVAIATMTAVGALARGFERAYPGSLTGAIAGTLFAFAIGWWLFGAVRRARASAGLAPAPTNI
jgi:hypothetical protein